MDQPGQTRITTVHAKKLGESVGSMLLFLYRLRERLEAVGVPPNDDLFLTVSKAHDAVHH